MKRQSSKKDVVVPKSVSDVAEAGYNQASSSDAEMQPNIAKPIDPTMLLHGKRRLGSDLPQALPEDQLKGPEEASYGQVARAALEEFALPVYKTIADVTTAMLQPGNLTKKANEGKSPFFNESIAHFMQEEDPNFVPLTPEIAEQFDPQYWGLIYDSKNEYDRQRTMDDIRNTQENFEAIQSWGWSAAPVVLGAALANPLNFIPTYGALKYAKVGEGFFKNAIRGAQGALIPGVLDATAKNLDDRTRTTEDFLFDVVADAAVMGAMGGISGAGLAKLQMMNRAQLAAINKDVEILQEILPDGTLGRTIAKGNTLSSMESVPRIQKMIDESIAGIPESGIGAEAFNFVFGQSAVVKGLRSPFVSERAFTNRLATHKFVTGGIEQGQVPKFTADDYADLWQSTNGGLGIATRSSYNDYVASFESAIKDGSAKPLDREGFRSAIGMVMHTGESSGNPIIDNLAENYRKTLYQPLGKKMVDHGFLSEKQFQKNFDTHANRIYKRANIASNVTDSEGRTFKDKLGYLFQRTNQEISELRAPLTKLEAELKEAKLELYSEGRDVNELKAINNEYTSLRLDKEQAKRVLGDKYESILAVDRDIRKAVKEYNGRRAKRIRHFALKNSEKPAIKAKEQKEFRKHISYLRDVRKRILSNPEFKEYAKIADNIKGNRKAFKGPQNEAIQTPKKQKIVDIEQRLLDEERKLEQSLGALREEKPWMFYPDGSLRRVRDESSIIYDVEDAIDNILGLDDSQLAQATFGAASSRGATFSSNALKSRSLLYPNKEFLPWLETDILKMAGNYSGQLGRIDGVAEMMKGLGKGALSPEEAKASFINELKEEFKLLERNLDLEGLTDAAKRKKITGLRKDFDKSVKRMNDMLNVFMGTYADKPNKFTETANFIANYNVITKLGKLGITIMPQLAAPAFVHGIGSWLREGMGSLIANPKSIVSRSGSKARNDLSDTFIGVHVAAVERLKRQWGEGFEYSPGNSVSRVTKDLANNYGNITLANQMQDLIESVAGNMAQSHMLRLMDKFTAGKKLTQKEIEYLGKTGFDYHTYGHVIMDQAKKHGEKVYSGWSSGKSYWDDTDIVKVAKQNYDIALRRATNLSGFEKNKFDKPLLYHNPYFRLISQFTGWIWTAMNTYALPLVQRADADKLAGMLPMLALGALVYPTKQKLDGEEVDWNEVPKQMFFNSGLSWGWQMELLQRLNPALDLPIFRQFQNNKYAKLYKRGQSGTSVLLGPTSGAIDEMFNVTGMIGSGEWNQQDLKKLMRIFPFTTNPFLSPHINEAINGLNMPKTRQRAKTEKED